MIKPTIREVRVILSSLNDLSEHLGHYNDKRKNGGRIKLSKQLKPSTLAQLQSGLESLFPNLEVEVYNHLWKSPLGMNAIVTCVKWKCAGTTVPLKW
jgi:hypothetical protein